MAKLEYNSTKVNNALDALLNAKKHIENFDSDIAKAISTIKSISGIENVSTNGIEAANGMGYNCAVAIDETHNAISQRALEVKKYNEDYDKKGFGEKLLSTVLLSTVKLGEVVLTAG